MTPTRLSPSLLEPAAIRERAAARTLERLGLINGLLFGLALALGAYVPAVMALSQTPMRLVVPLALLGAALMVGIATLAGWLGARFTAGWAAPLAWIVAALLITLVAGHLPYEGNNLVVWLADRRFWGRNLYPFDSPALIRMLLAGFFVALGLVIFGVLQDYRLEGIRGALNRGRLTLRAGLLLVLPLPLIVAVGFAIDNNISQPLRVAPLLVDDALTTAQTYRGDLAALGRQTGINYAAVNGVRDLIDRSPYSLMLGAMDLGGSQEVYLVAHFDNGAWVNCRLLSSQLSHCYDASPPYTLGLAGALSGAGTPACQACNLRMTDGVRAWLRDHGQHFTGTPTFTRPAQWGSHVLMRATDAATGYAIDCWMVGLAVPEVTGCEEVTHGT